MTSDVDRTSKYAQIGTWRFRAIIGLLLIILVLIIWRMLDIMVIHRQFLLNQGDARILRTEVIPAYRGIITDRRGEPLAISTPVDSVWIDPQSFDPTEEQLSAIAQILAVKIAEIRHKMANTEREFIYLKRAVIPDIAAQVKKLGIPGLYLQREYRRYYPDGEVTGHILGFTNIDDQGQEGLELGYNQWLHGAPGLKRVIKDRLGHVIADVEMIRPPSPGRDLVLSIDRRIQYLAYRELKEAVVRHQAQSGSLVVLDAKTGEVLAMVNQPSFNPNARGKIDSSRFRNRAVTDVFEPGSTVKAFTVANALASGKYNIHSRIDTSPGYLSINGNAVTEWNHRNNGVITMSDILKRSSNVGIAKLALSLPPQSIWQLFHQIGFGQLTNVGFPGEQAGLMLNRERWSPFGLVTFSFGYGLTSTTLQLARAYSVLAAEGRLLPVSLLRLDKPPVAEQILDPVLSKQVLEMLTAVVDESVVSPVAIPGYHVAGKTGTVRVVGPSGYDKHRHHALFAGVAPATNPRLVIALIIREPQGQHYYGTQVAVPVFTKVMAGALHILDVPPDNVQTAQSNL